MADPVDGVGRDSTGQQYPPSAHQGFDVCAAVDEVRNRLGGCASGGVGRVRHRCSEVERRGCRYASSHGVGDELHQRGAPGQVLVAVGDQQSNLAGPGQEPVGLCNRWEELGELVPGDRDRGFVSREADGVVHPEHIAQTGTLLPGIEQVTDRRDRIATLLKAGDPFEPPDVGLVVEPAPTDPRGRMEDLACLVLADGANRSTCSRGQFLDRHARRFVIDQLGFNHT